MAVSSSNVEGGIAVFVSTVDLTACRGTAQASANIPGPKSLNSHPMDTSQSTQYGAGELGTALGAAASCTPRASMPYPLPGVFCFPSRRVLLSPEERGRNINLGAADLGIQNPESRICSALARLEFHLPGAEVSPPSRDSPEHGVGGTRRHSHAAILGEDWDSLNPPP